MIRDQILPHCQCTQSTVGLYSTVSEPEVQRDIPACASTSRRVNGLLQKVSSVRQDSVKAVEGHRFSQQ
jgi:hypothetical protein